MLYPFKKAMIYFPHYNEAHLD